MATSFLLRLDTTGPAGVALTIEGGATAIGTRDVSITVTTTDPDTTGYGMKVYGDVDDAAAPSEYRAVEANAPWIGYTATRTIRLSTGDGPKTIRVRLRDEVDNPSSEAVAVITLDTTAPVSEIVSGPAPTKISKQPTKNVSSVTWRFDTAVVAYELRVVPAPDSVRTAGTIIPTTNGSVNVSGGALAAGQQVTSEINAADLELASPGDGDKQVKVFGRDQAENWTTVA